MEALVRWTVMVTKETDVSLRAFLAQRGMKKGDLSKFIEQAVQKAVFSQTVVDVEARNVDISDNEIDASINDALRHVRADKWGAPRTSTQTKKVKRV